MPVSRKRKRKFGGKPVSAGKAANGLARQHQNPIANLIQVGEGYVNQGIAYVERMIGKDQMDETAMFVIQTLGRICHRVQELEVLIGENLGQQEEGQV